MDRLEKQAVFLEGGVLDCFISELRRRNIEIKTNCEVVEIKAKNNEVIGVYLRNGRILKLFKGYFGNTEERVIH